MGRSHAGPIRGRAHGVNPAIVVTTSLDKDSPRLARRRGPRQQLDNEPRLPRPASGRRSRHGVWGQNATRD